MIIYLSVSFFFTIFFNFESRKRSSIGSASLAVQFNTIATFSLLTASEAEPIEDRCKSPIIINKRV